MEALKVNTRNAFLAIERRQTFTAGAITGRYAYGWDASNTGELPAQFADEFARTVRAGRPVYVVWSYRTPIGWAVDNGPAVVPDVWYSNTTARHQSQCRRAFDVLPARKPVARVECGGPLY